MNVRSSIYKIDRLPSGGVEVIDYKTGRVSSQKGVHESLQLSIYALACRDALGLGTPERVMLYFCQSRTLPMLVVFRGFTALGDSRERRVAILARTGVDEHAGVRA